MSFTTDKEELNWSVFALLNSRLLLDSVQEDGAEENCAKPACSVCCCTLF